MYTANEYSFLTGADSFIRISPQNDETQGHSVLFDKRHEGFIGIPHGGIGMGLCMEQWDALGKQYPLHAKFRFGGSGISIGESGNFEVSAENGSVTARITKPGDKTPYLKADMTVGFEEIDPIGPVGPMSAYRPLPYYSNCFVCGRRRSEKGLVRQFMVSRDPGDVSVCVEWGPGDDRDKAGEFLIQKETLHPAVIISIFDENTAWAGFMTTQSGAVSTKLDFCLKRPIARDESLVFWGRPTGVRGNPKSPRFFLARGAVYSMKNGTPECVAHGFGEWVILPHYTSQIRENLLPEDDSQWIFDER